MFHGWQLQSKWRKIKSLFMILIKIFKITRDNERE